MVTAGVFGPSVEDTGALGLLEKYLKLYTDEILKDSSPYVPRVQ